MFNYSVNLAIVAMPLLKSSIQSSIPTFAASTPLTKIIDFMGGNNRYFDIETQKSEVASNDGCLALSQFINNCVFVVEDSRLLGIFTKTDLINVLINGANITGVSIAEVMKEPIAMLCKSHSNAPGIDAVSALAVMRQHNIRYLPIIGDGKFLGVITPEIIAEQLQIELTGQKQKLQQEIAQRSSLELGLNKTKKDVEKQILQQTEELVKANQILQRGIGNCIATETQLLQTTSEFQEIFQAFPDIYFRLKTDGTILSCHANNLSDLYLPPVDFLGKRMQEVLPIDVADKFQEALTQLQQTKSLVAIEYTLEILGKQKSFEARFLPSIQQQVVVLIRNITKRKQAQLALQNANEELENRVEARTSELQKTNELLRQQISERQRVEQALRISEERYARAIYAGKVGIWEWNIETNDIFVDRNLRVMLGYNEDEIFNDFQDWLKCIHPDDINAVKGELNAYIEGLIPKYEIEHRMLDKNGNYVWFLARGTIIRDELGKPCFIAGSNTNIAVRKHTENRLKASLKEKDLLLKEIHHRVKNNLQVISSLLRLQSGYIKDRQALEIFRDSQNRVRAMAMIHENLYQSNDLGRINFSDYIRNLINNLIRCYGLDQDKNIKLNVDKVSLRIDTAIPCGLIINELVSNAIKHAFVETATGDIYIDFIDLGQGKYSLSVSDNGIGVPDDIEIKRSQSLGLQLVWNLVEQLEGTIAFNTKLGTLFTITFVEQN
jgi:PAS domain S-box-containing protein